VIDGVTCARRRLASRTRTLTRVPPLGPPSWPAPALSAYPNTSPPEPSGPRYSARVALSCERGHAPGQVLQALQELRSVIDDRLRGDLGGRYDRHSAQSAGTDKLTVTFTLRAANHADAIRSAGLAAGTLAELLTDNAAAVDLSGVALVVRAQ
jgi:outer membrane receptor protein involved in Fe transport